jgi:tetratricopeptide (TPR) repeat protein
MSLDPYSFCPCGSGKKIKFCCCSDLASDLDRVIKMFAGDQRIACLAQVDKLINEGKDRAAFLAIKTRLHFELEQVEEAKEVVQRFFEKYPDNPIALSQSAILQSMDPEGPDGVDLLQRAFDICEGKIPSDVVDALGSVAQRLLADGKVIAARAHLMITTALNEEDENSRALVAELMSSQQIPMLLRTGLSLYPVPEDAPYRSALEEAVQGANLGLWAATVEKLEYLTNRFPEEPAVWSRLATMQCYLGHHPQAVEALRRFVGLKRVSLEAAVEAEALAQMLDVDSDEPLELRSIVFHVPDAERLIERLLSDPQASRLPDGLTPRTVDEDAPPPKVALEILDRPKLTSMADIELTNIPRIVGELFVFGKQTDRDARAEFILPSIDLESSQIKLCEWLGDLLGAEESQVKVADIPGIMARLELREKFPEDATPDQIDDLRTQSQMTHILECWPHIEMRVLDGKSPAAAASIAPLRKRLLACLLRLEMGLEQIPRKLDSNQLRANLGIPCVETIDPWKKDIPQIPIWQLSHVDILKLSDEQLYQSFQRAVMYGAAHAISQLGLEALTRDSLREQLPTDVLHGLLGRWSYSSRESLDHLLKAREAAVDNGRSPAVWIVAELPLRFQRREVDEFEKLVEEIQLRYIDEPGILPRLQQTLMQLGFVSNTDEAPEETAEPVLANPTEAASEIWTPENPASSKESDKPGLWVPGDD